MISPTWARQPRLIAASYAARSSPKSATGVVEAVEAQAVHVGVGAGSTGNHHIAYGDRLKAPPSHPRSIVRTSYSRSNSVD